MTYSDAIEYIHSVHWNQTRMGLDRIRELLQRMGDPHRSLKFIHIAGTNGKGSTAAMLASVLSRAGYRTGLYTSPYIERFNERIQVNGTPISDDDLCTLTEAMRPLADSMEDHPTEFELVTALGFEYFRQQECEIVVLEVGMGGEWDATNVIPTNEVAIITNIGLDHMMYLGDTKEKIARTKAGILKAGCPCVLYPQIPSVERVIREISMQLHGEVVPADMEALRLIGSDLDGQRFDWADLKGLKLPLLGAHQLRNACTVLTTLRLLRAKGWSIPESAIREGLAEVRWPGRFQLVARDPLFIVDGGHNPQCLEALEEAIQAYLPDRKIVFLNGCMADKDYREMFRHLQRYASEFVTVQPNNPRALSAEALAQALREETHLPATPCTTVAEGVTTAIEKAGEKGVVCACGSLYMIGEIFDALKTR